jgi:hypothetical protein
MVCSKDVYLLIETFKSIVVQIRIILNMIPEESSYEKNTDLYPQFLHTWKNVAKLKQQLLEDADN